MQSMKVQAHNSSNKHFSGNWLRTPLVKKKWSLIPSTGQIGSLSKRGPEIQHEKLDECSDKNLEIENAAIIRKYKLKSMRNLHYTLLYMFVYWI